jgi:hypothetical protein
VRYAVAQIKEVELQDLGGLLAPGAEVLLDGRLGIETAYPDIFEVPAEHGGELFGVEQVDVERVLEVGRLVRGEKEGLALWFEHTRHLRYMALGALEVLDEVRRACVVERVPCEAQRQCIGTGEHQGLSLVEAGSVLQSVGAVIDSYDAPVRAGEANRFEPLAAAEVEQPAICEPADHRTVTGFVKGEKRVRGHALNRAFSGQPGQVVSSE